MSQSALSIDGYKLYHSLDGSDPDSDSPYFSSLEHPSLFTSTSAARRFANSCLPILGATSQSYSFRVVAQYEVDGDLYETHIDRGSTVSIELNATLPTYTSNTTDLNLPYCDSSTLAAADVDITNNFGRGLALSRDSGDPLRNLIASGVYRDSTNADGGAIRHYARAGAEFSASAGATDALEIPDTNAVDFGHNLAFPIAAVADYDLFIAGDPFYTADGVNTGFVQLYHKADDAATWSATAIDPGVADAASGAAVAIAVNNGNAFALYGEPRHDGDDGRIVLVPFVSGADASWGVASALTFSLANVSAAVSGDNLFGSAIAVSQDGAAVAVMSSRAIHIFSLSFNGSMEHKHSIVASDFLDVGASFVSSSVNSSQALALQKTELNNVYLLAVGIPHDSHSAGGIITGSGANNANTLSDTNYGGVLLLSTASISTALSPTTAWRQLAYLRSPAPEQNAFYGSNLQLTNPEQPVLLVSEPMLGYGYDAADAEITETVNSSDAGQLYVYYLNTDGGDADAEADLIFSPSNAFSDNDAGYAYAFDYANNTLALGSPYQDQGQVYLGNLFTSLDLSGSAGAEPLVLSSLALDVSANTDVLSFGVRFPATVDADTIADSDFSPVISGSGASLKASDFTITSVSGALDYWQVTLQVDSAAVSASKSGVVRLGFASGAEIKSSAGRAFYLAEFNSTGLTDGDRATFYDLDYDSPALTAIERLDPSTELTNQESVSFRIGFSKELNTSAMLDAELDDLLDDYFAVVASAGVEVATFSVADLDDTNIEVNASYVTDISSTMDVAISAIKTNIYEYTNDADSAIFADGVATFAISLYIDPSIASVLGDSSGNQLQIDAISPQEDTYSIDYQHPIINSLVPSRSSGNINGNASLTYTITFSEAVQPLVAGDFEFDINESSTSAYTTADGATDFATASMLYEIFGGDENSTAGSLTNNSGYSISPTDVNASIFTLFINIKEADFIDLISEEFHLAVLASGVTDVYGNALLNRYDDDTNYTINFNNFALEDYGHTIEDSLTGDRDAGDLTSNLNIFSFLDQVSDYVTTSTGELPSFGFSFGFTNPVDRTTVGLDDFDIKYGTATLDSGSSLTLNYPSGSKGDGSATTSTEPFAHGDPAISFSDDNKSIFLKYALTPSMLEYGFDLSEQLSIALKANNTIKSATSGVLEEGSQPLSYSVKAAMPLLTAFYNVDATLGTSANGGITGDYRTFNYNDGSSSGTYYGFEFQYSFSESIYSAQGSSAVAYSTPQHGYYLAGAQLLDYATQSLLVDPTANLIPDTSGANYSYFTVDGTLVRSNATSSSDPSSQDWRHLVYLSEEPTDFDQQTSEHNYSLVADADYLDTYTYANFLPVFFGGYDNGYSGSTDGTFFLDADGNPARIDATWLDVSETNFANSAIALTFDTKTPELTAVTALYVEDSDGDSSIDNYNGGFGELGDVATFAFDLTFDKEISLSELSSALIWDVTITSGATPNVGTTTTGPDPDTSLGYVYRTQAVASGLYDSNGTYSIDLDASKTITDAAGNTVDIANKAVLKLNDSDLCEDGTCSYIQTPVVLSGFSVDPAVVFVLETDTRSFSRFDVYLTFSEPVTFTADNSQDNDIWAAFELSYVNADTGADIASTFGASFDIDNTIASLQPVAASAVGSADPHYTEYNLSFNDAYEFWARPNYFADVGASSVASVFFEDTDDNSSGIANFINSFATASGGLVALPATIQSGAANSGTSEISYKLFSDVSTPELAAATPAAASSANSQNQNPDTPVARHVAFDFNDTLLQIYGTSAGMHILYRTEDDAFTNNNASTAPYYGADGGLFISGADLDANNIGYHICPPFSDRIHGPRAGSPSPNAPISYNPNRLKIHYIAIPYLSGSPHLDDSEIAALAPISVDFSTSADHLSDTEPCVRSTFYNQGVGQYGYIVDTDRDEEMMLIANAVLQDADGYNLDDARLPTTEHNNVYFDLYTRDYYNDSWQKDLTITLAQVLADLAGNIGAGSRHAIGSGVTIAFGSVDDSADDTIFASRFINTINARFLNNVFLDDLTADKIKGYDLTINEYIDSEVTPVYDAHIAAGIGSSNIAVVATSSNDISPRLDTSYISPEDTSAAALAPINQNRLVLSVGVHPASIRVDVGTSGAFNPFATDPAQLLEMDAAFYGLHYGGVAGTTKPAFDYTSRHLAYVNFDLVYELTRDATTGAITGYSLKEIVSPFTLLKTELFSSTTLGNMQTDGEVYSAVAASIADNVFRLNFMGNSTNDGVGHYLPVGAYCRISSSSPTSSACYNDFAQMLLPDPDDGTDHERTVVSDHYLHRHLLRLDPATYSPIETTENANYDLLTNFLYFSDSREDPSDYLFNTGAHPSHIIDERDYSTIIYNSFSRNYGLNFSNDNLSFDTTRNMDTDYISDTSNHSDAGQNLEQSFFGLSPFAESPNARADQILPNAFFLGNQTNYDHYFQLIVKPYQHTGYTADIKADLAAADDLNLISSHIYATTGRSTSSAYYDADHLFFASQGYFMHHQAAYGIPYSSGSEVSTSSAAGPRAFIGSYYYTDRYDYQSGHHDDDAPYSHIFASAPEHYNGSTRYINLGTNSTNEEHYVYSQLHFPSLFSGRLSGMSLETTADSSDSSKNNINDFSYHKEYQHDFVDALMPAALNLLTIGSYYLENSAGGNIKLSQLDAIPVGNRGAGLPKPLYNNGNRSANVDTFSQSVYDGGRVLTPADDYDFDRGQTLARKLGFFLSEGIIFQSTDSDLDKPPKPRHFQQYIPPHLPRYQCRRRRSRRRPITIPP